MSITMALLALQAGAPGAADEKINRIPILGRASRTTGLWSRIGP
jgi:hypothetical protein